MNRHLPFLLTIGILGLASGVESRASVFACLLLVIGFASLSRFEHPKKRAVLVLLVLASLSTAVGMVRFIWGEALQGISEARGRATSKKAVSLLREILFAQDAMRRYGMIDHDGDGVGSAGLLGELCGAEGARGKSALATPPLSPRFCPRSITSSGPANEQDGYLLMICLPTATGAGWVNRPGTAVDEELAERRWVAYAWPVASDLGHEAAYFINEHEEILESPNKSGDELRLVGPQAEVHCDDALSPPTKARWKPWRGKTRRAQLPGEK